MRTSGGSSPTSLDPCSRQRAGGGWVVGRTPLPPDPSWPSVERTGKGVVVWGSRIHIWQWPRKCPSDPVCPSNGACVVMLSCEKKRQTITVLLTVPLLLPTLLTVHVRSPLLWRDKSTSRGIRLAPASFRGCRLLHFFLGGCCQCRRAGKQPVYPCHQWAP